MNQDYQSNNRDAWNKRVSAHLTSDFYDVEGWKAGKTSLNDIELELLGEVKDKSILHLQCHFGQDSLSLARMGANVVGVDLSDESIAVARKLNEELGLNAEFVESDVLELIGKVDQKFDIVFTSYGTISWLPDLDKWAKIISRYLKPNGKFVFVEFHPVVWMFDDNFEKIKYNYFNSGAIVETESGTYADKTADITQEYVMWNHGLGEVSSSLLKQGLSIDSLTEYDYAPYNFIQKMEEFEPGKFRVKHFQNKAPLVYSIIATKP